MCVCRLGNTDEQSKSNEEVGCTAQVVRMFCYLSRGWWLLSVDHGLHARI